MHRREGDFGNAAYWFRRAGSHPASPAIAAAAAEWLKASGAALVGIDSYNIDSTSTGARPAHTILLGADIPIVEHMRGLKSLPDSGFTFNAVPVKVKKFGTFPVRATSARVNLWKRRHFAKSPKKLGLPFQKNF